MPPGPASSDFAVAVQVDYFQREASKLCKETEAAVLELKAASVTVAQACAAIKATMLVNIERKRLYDVADFDARQAQQQVPQNHPPCRGLPGQYASLHMPKFCLDLCNVSCCMPV
jgi:hypothetical protein